MRKNDVIGLGGDHWLTIKECREIARSKPKISLRKEAYGKMEKSRKILLDFIVKRRLIYGINTQFGSQVNLLENNLFEENYSYVKSINDRQKNLIISHNCGLGEEMSEDIIRATMALRAHCLGLGYSGARPVIVEALINFLKNNIHPIIRVYGSIGASGDLIPLSAVAAALIGEESDVYFNGKKIKADQALNIAGLEKISLETKEGLCLINGTSFMSAVAALSFYDLERLFNQMLSAIAMSLEALLVIDSPYYPLLHNLKHHSGSIEVNEFFLAFWRGSKLIRSSQEVEKENLARLKQKGNGDLSVSAKTLQDYYSLRAVPQGFGPMKENLATAKKWIENEINSVNDNPIIDVKKENIYNGANFMGYYITEACDLLKIDIAQASNWLHAILANLVNPRKSFGLPANIIDQSEIYNAFKPLQILAASLTVQNRKFAVAHQAYMIPTEGDNQDVNSLAAHAAIDFKEAVKNLERLTAILFLAAAQALSLRGLKNAGVKAASVHKIIREKSSFIDKDRLFAKDIEAVIELMRQEKI